VGPAGQFQLAGPDGARGSDDDDDDDDSSYGDDFGAHKESDDFVILLHLLPLRTSSGLIPSKTSHETSPRTTCAGAIQAQHVLTSN